MNTKPDSSPFSEHETTIRGKGYKFLIPVPCIRYGYLYASPLGPMRQERVSVCDAIKNILEWELINGKTRCRFFFIFLFFFGREKEKEKGYIGGFDWEKAREWLDDI